MNYTLDLPHEAVDLYNKGTYYLQQGKYDKAEKYLRNSLRIYETTDAWLNLGTVYKFLDKDNSCQAAFLKASSSDIYCMETCHSVQAMAFNNLGLMAYVHGDDILAEQYYNTALSIWPDFPDCQWNLSTCILRRVCSGSFERWAEGWLAYDSRFKKSSAVNIHSIFGHLADKMWNGQRDCRVVIAQEQGIGDNIMFSRFIPQLALEYNLTACDFQIGDSLGRLLRANGISCPEKLDVRNYDYVLPLGSICGFVSHIDRAPYITMGFESIDLLESLGHKKLNIGVVWSGSDTHSNNRHRSCPVGYFKFLTQYGTLWNLNPGAKDVPKWVNRSCLSNWTETASLLASLDFVVTVDTSVAHLAGAMGVPCYMLQPCKETDFRWGKALTVNGISVDVSTQNIWYDSVHVIANPNNWNECMINLKKELLHV